MDGRLVQTYQENGHEVETVWDENLSGAADDTLYNICMNERCILVTQDLDFSNPFRFPPQPTEGIIVLRNPTQLLADARELICSLCAELENEDPRGQLWVVARKGIRIWPSE